MDDISEKEKMKRDLCNWLQQSKNKVFTIDNKAYSNGAFSIKSSYRPDILIESQKNNYLVKFESAEDTSQILDGYIRIIDYWKQFAEEDAEVERRGKQVSINAVLIASNYSPQGHLFHDQNRNDPQLSSRSEGAQKAAAQGQIPKFEHTATEKTIRMLWRYAEGELSEATVGIGALLSSTIDASDGSSTSDESVPAALYKTPGQEYVQHWDYIPFFESD